MVREPDEFHHPLIVSSYDTINGYQPGTQPDFYRQLAGSIGDSIHAMELGCGSGIVACLLAEDGHRVVGVDPSQPMLDLARDKSCDVEWVLGGYEALSQRDADMAFMSGHVAQFLLSDEVWADALQALRTALVDGGTLAFESRNPDAREWENWGKSRVIHVDPKVGRIEHWSEAHGMEGEIVTYTNHYRFLELDEHVATVSRLRFRTMSELVGSLESADFTVQETYGWWDRRPVTTAAPEYIIVATARP